MVNSLYHRKNGAVKSVVGYRSTAKLLTNYLVYSLIGFGQTNFLIRIAEPNDLCIAVLAIEPETIYLEVGERNQNVATSSSGIKFFAEI